MVSSRLPSRFPYLGAAALSLALGLVSLVVLPRSLSYDPWSWLSWGRELDHLALTTRASATSFKPLTVFVAALLSPTGQLAPRLWLAISRTGLVLTLLLSFHIGRRFQGPVAGVLAVGGVLTIYDLVSYLALTGMSEPLVAAACLAAVDHSLSRRHRAAFAWLAVASLMELEIAAVAACYGLAFLVWPSGRRARGAVGMAALLLVIAACWMLPDLLSTGNALRSVKIARNATLGGPELARVPFLATLRGARGMVLWPVSIGWLAEIALGATLAVRRRVLRPLFAPALVAGLFVVGCALLAQLHMMTGNTRFMVGAAAVGVVVAACLWVEGAKKVTAWVVSAAARRSIDSSEARRRTWRGANAVALGMVFLALLLVARGGLVHWRDQVRAAIVSDRALQVVQAEFPRAVTAAGGRAAVLSCGPIEATPLMVPFVAWELDLPTWHVGDRPGSVGTVFTTRPPGVASGIEAMDVLWSHTSDPDRRPADLYVLSSCLR